MEIVLQENHMSHFAYRLVVIYWILKHGRLLCSYSCQAWDISKKVKKIAVSVIFQSFEIIIAVFRRTHNFCGMTKVFCRKPERNLFMTYRTYISFKRTCLMFLAQLSVSKLIFCQKMTYLRKLCLQWNLFFG